MTNRNPTEMKFEEYIEKDLQSTGYFSISFSEYDRSLCLIGREVINFIKSTQPDNWNKLQEIHGINVENRILSRISDQILKRGVIDVFQNQIVDQGVYLNLCYFEPKSALNPEHRKLYQSNRFTLVRQLSYSNKNKNSIDMVLFLNGLPIITMELKNQLTGQNIKYSEAQYRNNRDPGEPLLRFKRCIAHFCVDNDKVSMTTRLARSKTVFLPYNRNLENPQVVGGYRTEYIWKEILAPNSLIDILENFVHVSKERTFLYNPKTQKIESKIKEPLIFPRYHQLELIRKFKNQLRKDGVGKNYLVQHSTGSGKSYSIGWLSHTLASLYQSKGSTERMFDTIVVVTDRRVLDDQLRHTIISLEKMTGVVGAAERSSQELKELLEQGRSIVITTIQKFSVISETISALRNQTFGVIIDEVHSSQSGEMSKDLSKSLSKVDEDDDLLDYEDILMREIQHRGEQNHISFFGFTGTPKERTLEKFGTKNEIGQFVPFHKYSMYQSIHEGFTLDVLQNYTTYKRYFKLRQADGENIELPISKGTRELIKYVDAHEMTIREKVGIMLDHWVEKGSKGIRGQSRGMFVTESRKHCILYFKEINRQLRERGLHYYCLVAFSGEVSLDGERYTEAGLNETVGHMGNIPLGLKEPQFRLLVVADKFQTGFDEPLVQSMYIDKKLEGIHCVQTLSRLNRTTSGKTQTFVLDFVNGPEVIRNSFQRFYQSTVLEGETDPNRIYDIQREIHEYHLYTHEDVNRFCEVFYDLERSEGVLHSMLDRVVDKFKSIEAYDRQERFKSKIQSYIRLYGYLSQIIKFTDIELEKSYLFLRYLNKKLPKRENAQFNILDTIELDSLRIQKTYEHIETLEKTDAILSPPELENSIVAEPEFDLLSEIINRVNNRYGINLTEEDRMDLSHLNKELLEDPEVKKYMDGDNTEDNKRDFFEEQFDDKMFGYTQDRFEFYKKIANNSEVRGFILHMLYTYYQDQKTNV